MAGKNDFENRYFNALDQRFDSLDKSIAANTKATEEGFKAVNGRLNRVEKKVFPEQPQTIQQLPPIWKNPELIKLFTYIVAFFLVAAVIYASLKGIKLPI